MKAGRTAGGFDSTAALDREIAADDDAAAEIAGLSSDGGEIAAALDREIAADIDAAAVDGLAAAAPAGDGVFAHQLQNQGTRALDGNELVLRRGDGCVLEGQNLAVPLDVIMILIRVDVCQIV